MKRLIWFVALTIGIIAQPAFALSTAQGNAIANAALSRIGTPYIWGGKTTAGFDCSGLASWAYRVGGFSTMPEGTAHTQYEWCSRCTTQRGALLFFDVDRNGTADHVAIQDSRGYMIHSVQGQGVVRQRINSWYRARQMTSASR